MRGGDFIVFRVVYNGNDCNLMPFCFSNELKPWRRQHLSGTWNYRRRVLFLCGGSAASSGVCTSDVELGALHRSALRVKTTLQMTRFRDAKLCNNLGTHEIDDHSVQSHYKYKSELQNPEGKNSVLGIASARWNRATRRTTPMKTLTTKTQSTFHKAHMNVNTLFDARVVQLSGSGSHDLLTTSWLKFDLCASVMLSVNTTPKIREDTVKTCESCYWESGMNWHKENQDDNVEK